MKNIQFLFIFTLTLFFTATSAQKTTQKGSEHPNIIFFLVDDMGWQDTSVPFWNRVTPLNQKYHTPNMERLAKQGMKFTQAYTSAVCSPTRCSLISGMNAARHRVTNWTLKRNDTNDAADQVLEFPDWNVNGVQPVDRIERSTYITPLPAMLKSNGYFTIHAGKAHFGAIGTPAADPLNLGFDINIAGHAAGGPASFQGLDNFGSDENGNIKSVWSVPGLKNYHGKDVNLTDALTMEAMLAMDSARYAKKPFYLYMSHYAVHVPLQPDRRFYKAYRNRGYSEQEAVYASMVEGMDKSLGDLLNYIETKGISDNTVVIFLSDNGGYSASGKVRGGEPHTQNMPLNSGKGSAYEGGIRVPMIVKWPGKVRPGSVTDSYLIAEDFFPSMLEMAGVAKYSTVQKTDGKSFVPVMLKKKKADAERELVWHYPNKWGEHGPGIGATSSIRKKEWKLIYYYETGKFELFNIIEDIGEKNNLAGQHPEIVAVLSKRLGRFLRSVNAQRPVFKSLGKVVPWPDEV